jgi:hypothetical protein
MLEKILLKWKNYVLNHYFDEDKQIQPPPESFFRGQNGSTLNINKGVSPTRKKR